VGRGWLGGLAAAERNSGVMLLVPIVLLFLYGPREDAVARIRATTESRLARLRPRYRLTPKLGLGATRPAGLAAYVLVLALTTGDGLAPFRSQEVWFRNFAGPLGGIWDGAVAAWDGLRQLLHGPAAAALLREGGGRPDGDRGTEPDAVSRSSVSASPPSSGRSAGCRSHTAPTASRRSRCRSPTRSRRGR